MTVGELRRILQYSEDDVEVVFKDPVRGHYVQLKNMEHGAVWQDLETGYEGRMGYTEHRALVLIAKDD